MRRQLIPLFRLDVLVLSVQGFQTLEHEHERQTDIQMRPSTLPTSLAGGKGHINTDGSCELIADIVYKAVDRTTCCHVISVLSAADQSVSVSTSQTRSPLASIYSAPSKFCWYVTESLVYLDPKPLARRKDCGGSANVKGPQIEGPEWGEVLGKDSKPLTTS